MDILERRAFVGRGSELARLADLLAIVEAGDGRTAIIAGEAGLGKSRLVSRLIEVAGDRVRAEIGACPPGGPGGLPYAAVVEILRNVIEATEPGEVAALLGPGRSLLARLLPEIASRDAEVPVSTDADPTAQVRLFELILRALRRLSERRPLILVVEDVQWADRSTRDLLAFLVRGLAEARVLILLTIRAGEETRDGPTLAFLAELERDDGVERIDLLPFGRPEVADQVRALLAETPGATVVDRLWHRSDGNPFFVEELVLAGGDRRDLPVVVRDVIAARLADLSAQTREVLRAATIGGRTIDEALLIEVLGIDRRTLAQSLREAVAAGVLEQRDESRPLGFRHALLREIVERELFPGERAGLHRAFAQALEGRIAVEGRSGAAASVNDRADLARHWDGAGEPARALRPTVEAARAAEAVYAWPEALERWERARELFVSVPDARMVSGVSLGELLGAAADCALMAGEPRTAIQLGRAAIDAVDPDADAPLVATLENRLRWYLWQAGDREAAAAAIEAAYRLIPAQPPSQARARVLAQRAGVMLFAGRYAEAERDASEAIGMVRGDEWPGELALSRGVLGWARAAAGDIEGGLAEFRAGQAIAVELGSAEGVAIAATNLVVLLDRVGRSREVLLEARAGYAVSERVGVNRTYGALLLGYEAKAQFVLGLWDEAQRTISSALRIGPSEPAELWLSINRARLLAARGQLDEADALVTRCQALEARLGGTEFLPALLLAQAELGLWLGDIERVRAAVDAGEALAMQGGTPDAALAWLAIAAVRAEADALDRDAGRTVLDGRQRADARERLSGVAAAVGAVLNGRPELGASPRSAAIQAQYQAELSRLEGRPSPALWADAAERWTALDRPYSAAYARYREAAAIVAGRGERRDALAVLRTAREGAVGLGASPLLRLIDGLAKAARLSLGSDGGALGQDAVSPDPYGFTPREREVLDLVVDGRTNRQIAEQLFITRKTASVHVSNVMAKLGAANRGEAAAMARSLGLAD